jgi:hypothetical protein
MFLDDSHFGGVIPAENPLDIGRVKADNPDALGDTWL